MTSENSIIIDNNTELSKENLNTKPNLLITTNTKPKIDNSNTPTLKTTTNNNELAKSPSLSNNQQINQSTSTSSSPSLNETEVTPTNQTTDKKRSFIFRKSGKNKPRSFSLNFKSSRLKSNSNSPNLSFDSINNNNNNNSLNNNSISTNNSSSSSLNNFKKSSINQSAPSLENNLNNQPLRSESSISLKEDKSESHSNLTPSPSQSSHRHHHLFFHSLDRHHSRHSSNPSLNNSEYSSSLAIPPHRSSISVNQTSSVSTSESSINNTPMIRKASSRSTLNSTKANNENVSSSPVPMGMGIEDYEIGAQIGNGSSAVVYVAKYKPSQKTVCLKVIDLDKFERNQIEGLRKEIQIMSLCKHPNLLTVYGSFVHESKLYIVTPLLSAGSCLNIMKYAYPDGFEETVIATILKQALLGLEYLHKNGLIHRDVKAGNLLMSEEGLVQLADFGVSSSLMETGERKGLRKTFVGTPCWMAPEVMEQSGYDYKADIWSFGITAIEMATGRAPFAKYPPIKVLMLTIENEPPTLDRDQCRHKYSRTFKEMIDLCLNKDPSKRPSAEKLLQHPFFKQAKKKSYLADTILQSVPSIQMRPLKIVKQQEVEDENITWDFDSDDEGDKAKVVKFASSEENINNLPSSSSVNSLRNTSSNCSINAEVNPLTPIKEDNISINKNTNISINNTNSNLNNTIKNNISSLSSNNVNEVNSPSPPKYGMQRNSSSELGLHSLPRNKGRFIIDTGDSQHCESPASINSNSISNLNRTNSLFNNSTTNNNIYDSSIPHKFNNGTKAMLGRHLSLAEKSSSYSNDNIIIEKRSRFEVSSHPTPNTAEPKQSRFIIDEGRRSKVFNSEPPSHHSSNGSISSSNNSVNSNSYSNLMGSNNDIENVNLKAINKRIELLMQNSERQNKLIEALSSNILIKKITRGSIYNSSEESNKCIIAAEGLMGRLNELLKELDNLRKENEGLRQKYETVNKLNGQLNQKLMALEQENNMLMQKKNNLKKK